MTSNDRESKGHSLNHLVDTPNPAPKNVWSNYLCLVFMKNLLHTTPPPGRGRLLHCTHLGMEPFGMEGFPTIGTLLKKAPLLSSLLVPKI